MLVLILENNFSYTQSLSQWLCSLKGRKAMVNYSLFFLQRHYDFADLSFAKLFSKYCRYCLDFRIFCAS